MPFVDVLFSDFVPDKGGLSTNLPRSALLDAQLTQAENVVFDAGEWKPAFKDAAEGATAGAFGATILACFNTGYNSAPNMFVGTTNKLWQGQSNAWVDNSATTYAASDQWDFDDYFGTVVAVNPAHNLQYKDIVNGTLAANFTEATPAGGSLAATCVGVVRDHVVLGGVTNYFSLRWNAIGNVALWPTAGSATALANQAGQEDLLARHGRITNIVGMEEYGVVIQGNALTRMTYVGGDVVYQFDRYVENVGTLFRRSAIAVGGNIYFLGNTGVFVTDGFQVKNLSRGKVLDSILRNLNSHPDGVNAIIFVGVAYSEVQNSIIWMLSNAATGKFAISYQIDSGIFATNELVNTVSVWSLHQGAGSGQQISNIYQRPMVFDTSYQLYDLDTRSTVAVEMQTAYLELSPDKVTEVTGIRPLGIGLTPTIQHKAVLDEDDVDTVRTGFTSAEQQSVSKIFRVRGSGRYHAFRLTDSIGGDARIRGLRVYFEERSGR